MEIFARFEGRADDAERGAVVDRSQGAGVAVVKDSCAIVNQTGAQRAHAAVDADIVIGDPLRRRQQDFAQVIRAVEFAAVGDCLESIHRPSQVDRRRARSLEQVSPSSRSWSTSSLQRSPQRYSEPPTPCRMPAAAPIAGAPRTVILRMLSATASTEAQVYIFQLSRAARAGRSS